MGKTKWCRMTKLITGLLLTSCLFTGSILASETSNVGQTPPDRTGSQIINVKDNFGGIGLSMYVPQGMTVSDKSSADKAFFTDTSLKPFTGIWDVTVSRNEPVNGNLEDFLFRSMHDYYAFYQSETECDDSRIQEMFRKALRELDVNGTRVLWANIFWDYGADDFYAVFALPTGSAVSFHADYQSSIASHLFEDAYEVVIPKLLNEVVDCCIKGMSVAGNTDPDPAPETTEKDKITVLKKPTIKKLAAVKNMITVNWTHFKHTSKKTKKIWKPIKKVQIQCATDKAFSSIVKTVTVGKNKKKATIKGLNKNTTYFVRVRYTDNSGYSNWSGIKQIKTKK